MNIKIVDILVIAVLTSLSYFFLYKSSLIEKKKHIIAVITVMVFCSLVILWKTESGPMQSMYVSMFYLLGLIAVVDFFKKEIYLELFIAAVPLIILNLVLFIDEWDSRKLIFTIGVMLFFVIIGLLFRDSIGFGDILLFILLILAFEFQTAVFLILISFMLSAIYGLILFSARKVSKGYEIPLTPFLLAAYMVFIIL
jgi:prepilin signal peptidase PulO-like enzyme (type II secretory pathway)